LRSGLAAGAAVASGGLSRPAIAQARKKVTLVYGVQTIDSSADDFFAAIPLGLGYYAEEGLDVDIQTVAGASAAMNMLVSGQAQFTTAGTPGLFAAVDKGVPAQAFICQVPDYFVSIAVEQDGPIHSFADLKGKTIGVSANGGAPVFVTKAIMKSMGWNPDTDVQFLAVGTALPALDALRRGRVQALVEWDSIFALFEFHGGKFRYFRPEPIPHMGFTHATNTLLSTIDKQPEMVAGLGRAMAKAIVTMAAAPPEELAKLHFKVFPASRPMGMADADIYRLDGMRLAARKQFMRLQQRVFDRTEKIGDVSDARIESVRDLLHDGGEIKHAYPPGRYFTHQFIGKFNDIDVPGLIAKAKALRV
jgi:NitT/TauT family transport system substrate-binding protein